MERIFEIDIKATPERLWQAITEHALRCTYSFGVGVHSDWTSGSHYDGIPDGLPDMRILTAGRAHRGSRGRSRKSVTRVGFASRTISCGRARRPSSMAAGQWCCPASRRCWKPGDFSLRQAHFATWASKHRFEESRACEL